MPPLKNIAVTPTGRAGGRKRPSPTVDETASAPVDFAVARNTLARTRAKPEHRYQVGERLRLSNGGFSAARVESFCKVLSAMPYEGHGALLYRVRSEREQYDRIVIENDLSRNSDMT